MRTDVIPGAVASPGAPSIDPTLASPAIVAKGEVKGFLDRLTNVGNALQQAVIKDSWWILKNAGLLEVGNVDQIMLPMLNETDQLVNWVPNGLQAVNNGATWSAGKFLLDGVDDYINTGVNPSQGTRAWKLNSAHLSLDIRDIAMEVTTGDGGVPLQASIVGVGTSGGGQVYYIPFNGTGGSGGSRINTTTTTSFASSSGQTRIAHTLFNRIDSATVEDIFEGTLRESDAQPSAALPAASISIGRNGSQFAKFSVGAITLGGKLTTAQKAALLRVVQNMRRQFGM